MVRAQLLAQLGQAVREPERLQVVVDGRLGEEPLRHGGKVRFPEFAEPLLVRLGQFLGSTQERARQREIAGAESARPVGRGPFDVLVELVAIVDQQTAVDVEPRTVDRLGAKAVQAAGWQVDLSGRVGVK